ncbi:SusC/RagA family TonB-linked outer membrane protein [Draconibacterium sediminis]|uniref:SusC/RagA family TonB-linked outer membrane protein n=1 Tax=Draconibacterium sediminis TaxID=1544798 RepID=UPI0009E3AAE4|nr:TonB-dependent receptor [Draconibacterium sediminis]
MKRNLTYLLVCLFLFTSGISFAQHAVTGVVFDAGSNTTLPGVNVVEKGTTNGTITDVDGNFNISVSNENATLQFSFIGFVAQEVQLEGKSSIEVQLQQDVFGIEEVVAIGYGTQKKSDLTGSISVVETDEMAKTATNDVSKALQGKVAGVSIQSSGDPGAAPKVKIRGITSFTNNDPLYVIDGVFAPANDIPTENIESIQVLKDASAAAIYGSRAANGVIIITTKRGTKGEMNVSYSGYYGFQEITERMDVLDREQYQTLVNESTNNAKAYPEYSELYIFPANDPSSPYYVDNVNTNWQDELFKTGHINNQTISVSGGNEISNFSMSLNYFDQTGTVQGNGPNYTRYGIMVNSDHKLGKLKVGESIHYTYANSDLMSFLHDGTMLGYTASAIPTLPVYDETKMNGYSSASADLHGAYSANVIGMNNLIESNTKRYRLIGNVYGEYEIIKGLKYKLSLSYERTDWRDYHFEPLYDLGWFAGFSNTIAKMDDNRGYGYTGTIENTLSYNTTIDKLTVNALVGQSALNTFMSRSFGHAEGFSEPYFKQLSNGEDRTSSGDEFQSRLASYFGRVILGYDDKYLLTATIRRDGSSRFSPQNKWGNFPSVAVAWKAHQEDFLASSEFISQLKVRASYGVLGNQNIGDYRYQGYINPYASYVLNGNAVAGAAQFIPASTDIKWEQSKTTNIGLDFGLLENRILFTTEYYIKRVDDLLGTIPTPTHLGWYDWESPVRNALSVKNQGFEFNATYRKAEGEFKYSVNANFSTLKNEVLSLGEGINPIDGNWSRTDVGTEVGELYGYVVEKVFQSKAEVEALDANAPDGLYQENLTDAGDFMFKDLNNDNEITEDDRTHIGSALPNFYYGFNFNAEYKNFDFTVSAQGAAGNKVVNAIGNGLRAGAGLENMSTDLMDRWRPGNTDTGRPRIIRDDPNRNTRASDFWLEDGDYLRFSNIELGYTLPASALDFLNLSSVRLYGSVQNAITITKYSGYDPEFNNDGLFSRGTDNGAAANKAFTDFSGGLPTPRTILFGVKVGF